jgi:hypothetical protein
VIYVNFNCECSAKLKAGLVAAKPVSKSKFILKVYGRG